jgi:hypothetical protein
MGHQAVAIGFETTSQAFQHWLVAGIAPGQRGAGRQQRKPGIDIFDSRSDGFWAGEQRSFAGVFHQGARHRIEAAER